MPTSDALRVCREVAEILERLGIRCLVGGSLASSLHGIPRSTDDADLVTELREEHVEPFVTALGSVARSRPAGEGVAGGGARRVGEGD
jgi:hypothetical protein